VPQAVMGVTFAADFQPGTGLTSPIDCTTVKVTGTTITQCEIDTTNIPGNWDIEWVSGPTGDGNVCNGVHTGSQLVSAYGDSILVPCLFNGTLSASAPAFSPSPFYTGSPSATVTVSSSAGSFNNTYGMPLVQYFNPSSGALLAQGYATSIASDGSWISAATPSGVSVIPSGEYEGVVSLATSSGSYSPYVAVMVQVVAGAPPPPPGSGCGGGCGSGCGSGCHPVCLPSC